MLLQKKRHFKRNAKKSNERFLAVLGVMIIIVAVGSFFFLQYASSKRSYISPSSVFGKSLNSAEEVRSTLENRRMHPLSVRIASEGAVIVLLEKDREVIFSPSKPVEDQVSSLQRIENRLTIEGKAFKKIDFRFDNPVISLGEEDNSL